MGYKVCVPSNNLYGPVFNQTPNLLQIRGKLVKGRFSPEKGGIIIRDKSFNVIWDYPTGSVPDFGAVWFLPLTQFFDDYACYDGLILSQVESPESRIFRRVGFGSLLLDNLACDERESDAAEEIFTLV